MRVRWMIVVGMTAALPFLGGCAWFETGPVTVANASREECVVLTTALEKIAEDWRTNPGKNRIRIDAFAISADRIDSNFESGLTGLLPPTGVRPVEIVNCGTSLASISNLFDVVWPDHPIPTGDRRTCWRSDGGWISRAAIDADRTHAAVLYSENVCGERSWLVRMTRDYRGVWVAEAPDPLMRSVVIPTQQD